MSATTKDQKKKSVTKKKDSSSASLERASQKTVQKKKEESKQRLRIKIKAYDSKIIDLSSKQIVETASRYGAKISGPVPLPTEIRKYTVNRSTFVHKDAREQYEMRVHKRLIDILNPNSKIIDALMNINLPAGVDIEIKM